MIVPYPKLSVLRYAATEEWICLFINKYFGAAPRLSYKIIVNLESLDFPEILSQTYGILLYP